MEQIEKRLGKVFMADGKQAMAIYNDAIMIYYGLWNRIAQTINTGSHLSRNYRNPADIPLFAAPDMTFSP
jgi:hypothetical protein